MTTPNPFIAKAQARRERAHATMMGHYRALSALLARYDTEPGPGRDRIAARVEECKTILRGMGPK